MKESAQTLPPARPRFKPYPAYKDSGVEWLGEIPAHWNLKRLRSTLTGCQNGVWGDEPNGLADVPCVRVADFDRVAFRVNMVEPTLRSIEDEVVQSRGLRPGDLLLEKSGGGENQPVGAVVLYDHEALAVCSNFIARMTVADDFVPRFLTYLHAALYAARINTRSIKQNTGIQNLDSASYLSEAAAFPEMDEQRAIAAFLDRETARIDALVAKKERLIGLLQEKRTALITRAVTKGLDPNVPMKDSGVEWLGEIPAHWEVKPLKHLTTFATGWTPPTGREDLYGGEHLWANISDLGPKVLYTTEKTISDAAIREARMRMAAAGSLLFSFKLSVGTVSLAGVDMHTNEAIAAFAPCERIDTGYLYWVAPLLVPHNAQDNIYGAPLLNRDRIANATLLSPAIAEQRAIAAFLDRETARIDALVAKVRDAIDRLKELRTALISAAVTGKIDVREHAA